MSKDIRATTQPGFIQAGLYFISNIFIIANMNQSSHLYQLQGFDLKIEELATRLKEIEKSIADDKHVKLANLIVQKKIQAVEAAQKTVREAERSVKSTQIKIETNEASLYGGKVRNPKELQDLQSENSALKRRLSTLEDEQLDTMMSLENFEQELQKADKQLHVTTANSIQKKSSLLGEKTQITEKMDRLQVERKAILGSISPDNHATYQKIRTKKNGIAVAIISENNCSSCGATVRPALVQKARAPQQMVTCASCGRILYAG